MNQALIAKERPSPTADIDDGDGRSLSERAYDQLLDRMLSGEYPAGTLLQERPLADALQI
jgi:DNA-binding GntR family transcriptional regulator